MKPIYLVIFLFLSAAALSGCKKDCGGTLTRDATLYWTGDVVLDGCGFLINVAGTKFKPKNEGIIDDSYKQQDSTLVTIGYNQMQTQEAFVCGLAAQSYGVMDVVSIKRR